MLEAPPMTTPETVPTNSSRAASGRAADHAPIREPHAELFEDPRAALARPIRRRKPAAWRLRAMFMLMFFVAGVYVSRLAPVQAALGGPAGFAGPIDDVYSAIRRGFVEDKKPEDLQRGAIDGMLEALDDPYAEYIPPVEHDAFEKELTGQYSGIGCEVEVRDGWLTVVTPMEDSPALEAGIMANDRIVKVGETSTYRMTVDECIKLLVGPEGTPVSFVAMRDGKELPFTVSRRRIVSRSVRGVSRQVGEAPDAQAGRWSFMADPDRRIAMVRISQFTPTAGDELAEALEQAVNEAGDQGLEGLILDLRENPGGALDAALDVCEQFLAKGRIVSIRGRNTPEVVLDVQDPDSFGDVPMIIMVDGNSASASEIVSGALQDHKRAVILGSRTFGKGLVQTVMPLGHQQDGQVKFTTGKYYLPSGRLIQREDESTQWGVDPDPGFFVPETDEQLIARIERRRDLDVLRAMAPTVNSGEGAAAQDWSDPDWVEHDAKDPMLAAALRAMRTRLDTGAFKPVSDATAQHDKIAVKELRDLSKVERLTAMELARLDKRRRALEHAAATGEKAAEALDLWPDDLSLSNGTVDVKDKDGKLVASLRITGRDVERWLANADLEPITTTPQAAKPPAESPASPPAPSPPAEHPN